MAGGVGVYLEVGNKRVFAGALDWPGWCRAGRDEDAAIAALLAYGDRYRKALGRAASGFKEPADASRLHVVERLKGNATTDFGAPGIAPKFDQKLLDQAGLERLVTILKACWSKFDRVAKAAEGKSLSKGPRGGGRTVAGIVAHVEDAENGYLHGLGGRPSSERALRKSIQDALLARARGEVEDVGPRGGLRWTPRYFVRRTAWHALDHAWEIEDRSRERGG
jgi:hypothetical protein